MSDRVEVLLVDDDRNDIDVALLALRRENLDVEVKVANGGGEALEMLGIEARGDGPARVHPRVVFLDLKMPGVDGWEVLQRIRESPSTQKIPVVVLSWSGQSHEVERCYRLGANSYLVKRSEATRPGDYFAQAVRYWAHLNETPEG